MRMEVEHFHGSRIAPPHNGLADCIQNLSFLMHTGLTQLAAPAGIFSSAIS